MKQGEGPKEPGMDVLRARRHWGQYILFPHFLKQRKIKLRKVEGIAPVAQFFSGRAETRISWLPALGPFSTAPTEE